MHGGGLFGRGTKYNTPNSPSHISGKKRNSYEKALCIVADIFPKWNRTCDDVYILHIIQLLTGREIERNQYIRAYSIGILR